MRFQKYCPGEHVLSWAEYLSGCGAQLLAPIILRMSMSYAFARLHRTAAEEETLISRSSGHCEVQGSGTRVVLAQW